MTEDAIYKNDERDLLISDYLGSAMYTHDFEMNVKRVQAWPYQPAGVATHNDNILSLDFENALICWHDLRGNVLRTMPCIANPHDLCIYKNDKILVVAPGSSIARYELDGTLIDITAFPADLGGVANVNDMIVTANFVTDTIDFYDEALNVIKSVVLPYHCRAIVRWHDFLVISEYDSINIYFHNMELDIVRTETRIGIHGGIHTRFNYHE